MKRLRLPGLLLLLALPVGAAPAADEVIHPRRAEATGRPAGPAAGGSSWTTLGLAALCLGGAAWVFWHRRQGTGAAVRGAERRLAILETRSLGNRQHLVVADYAGRKFLLGVCPGRIDLLAPLDPAGPPSEP